MVGGAWQCLAVGALGLALLPSCGREVHVVSLDGIARDYLFLVEVLSSSRVLSLTGGHAPSSRTDAPPLPVLELPRDDRQLYVVTLTEAAARSLEPGLDVSLPDAVSLVDSMVSDLSTRDLQDLAPLDGFSVHRVDRDSWEGVRLVETSLAETPLASLLRLKLTRACAPVGLTALERWHRASLRPLAEHRRARGASAPLAALTAIDETRVLIPAGPEVYFLDARRPFDATRQSSDRRPGDVWAVPNDPPALSVERAIVQSSTLSPGAREIIFAGGRDAAEPAKRVGYLWRASGHAEGIFGPIETLVSAPETFFRALAIDTEGPIIALGDGGKVFRRPRGEVSFRERDDLPQTGTGERALAVVALQNPRRRFAASTPGVLHLRNREGTDDWTSTRLAPSDEGSGSDWSSLVTIGPLFRPSQLLAFGDGGGLARFDGQQWSREADLEFPPEFRDCAAHRGDDGPLLNRRDFVDAERAGGFIVFSVEGCDAVFWMRLEDRCVHGVHPPGKEPGSAEPASSLLDPGGIGALEVVGSAAGGWRVIALARDGAIWTATWGGP
jgi:hypothetical protein